jgi:hypothetical protein
MTLTNKLAFTILLSITAQLFCTNSKAQGNLMRTISIGDIKQQPMASVFDKIASKERFSFAYNNQTIPGDSLVSVSGFRGTIFSLLDKMLGQRYEYKEVPGYIVLRYAPRRLSVTAEISREKGDQVVIKGTVSNLSGQTGISRASVYEQNILVSTLTDDEGRFELKLKNWTGPITLAVSKENYRDTTVNMLQEVIVKEKHIPTANYKYYPNKGAEKDISHSRFAHFFIGSKQLIQDLNLGNYFAAAPYQVSLTPGLSSHGMYNSQVIDHFSLNVLGGYTAGIDGVEWAGLFNINKNDVSFLQAAGLFNVVGGNMHGIQFAGLYNNVLNDAGGVQAAGLVNRTHNFSGVQMAGIANTTNDVKGLQVAGLVNRYETSKGVALVGLANIAKDSSDAQIAGFLNKGGYVGVLQLAFINVAKRAKGPQIGLINIADSSDYPFGIINFIKSGEKSIAIGTDETLFSHIDFRSGGKVLYSLLGVAYKPGSNRFKYGFDIGLGAHLVNGRKFSLNAEYVASVITDMGKNPYQSYALKLMPGYNITQHLRLYAGPSLNYLVADSIDDIGSKGLILNKRQTADHFYTTSIGITGGLQFVW